MNVFYNLKKIVFGKDANNYIRQRACRFLTADSFLYRKICKRVVLKFVSYGNAYIRIVWGISIHDLAKSELGVKPYQNLSEFYT